MSKKFNESLEDYWKRKAEEAQPAVENKATTAPVATAPAPAPASK